MSALLLLLPLLAGAEERPTAVSIDFRGEDAEKRLFTDSLGELLSRLGLQFDAGEGRPRLATIEADFTAPAEGQLRVTNGAGKVVLLRLIPRGEKPAVAIEAAAHIAHSVIEELRDASLRAPLKARGPSPLPDPELAAPKPKPIGRGADPVALELGGFVDTRIWGGGAPFTVGFGLQIEVALALPRLRPALVWSGGYQPPFVVSNDWAQLFAHVVPLRLMPQVTPFGGDNWRIDAAIGGGTDIFIALTRSTLLPPGAVPLSARADAAPVLTAQVSGRFGLARSVDISLAVMLDVDLAPRRYLVDVGGAVEELFQPWRVRPAVLLGFSFAPVGKEPYAGREDDGS